MSPRFIQFLVSAVDKIYALQVGVNAVLPSITVDTGCLTCDPKNRKSIVDSPIQSPIHRDRRDDPSAD